MGRIPLMTFTPRLMIIYKPWYTV